MYIEQYNATIDKEVIENNLNRITDRIFKLLPMREEGQDWQISLHNLVLEIIGLNNLLDLGGQSVLFNVVIKLKTLETLTTEEDFLDFRKTIFECLSLMSKVKKWVD